ncbi:Fanconi anemia core complex-associated protein 24 [Acanthopagrus latus]|uniref:Fanconi anemia core complex-associated protein 24 n=1 Tax=Acanthopagrus latus TaxID=8177 RepID=UPI00187C91BC|nr:Fanconi anemia core complex-associated protein 24 [Acanthopagrus latus]XP_036964400.1 Fanconi anemia core complex-associated protein 24 [Acanthopagrus latus]XP_036964401.1 Fanconi anemia core complex-associated protein 24 [Acanthopagrus latus]
METKAAAVLNVVPPYGHVITSEKWRNSSLIQSLKGGGVKILFESELGAADFHLPNKSCVLYVSECDIIAASSYKRKLVRYRNSSSSFQELVLVENTRLSEQYFSAVQKFVVFDLGLTLLPVSGQTEASQLITQIVNGGGRENPFRRRSSVQLLDPLVLALVQQVPGVGRVKALALLQHFSSIQQLCNAAPTELEPIVGQAAAQQIHNFFHRPTAAGT